MVEYWKARCILEVAAFKAFADNFEHLHALPDEQIIEKIKETNERLILGDFSDSLYDLVNDVLGDE